jgi:hypothetical protein
LVDFAALALSAAAVVFAQTPSQMRVVEQGAQSHVEAARQVVARTAAEWTALWRDHHGAGDLPPVDFSKEVIAAVFLGTRPTAGYTVTIVGAATEGNVLQVRYRETAPAPDAMTAQVITYPYQIVAIPKSAATDVKFDKVQ